MPLSTKIYLTSYCDLECNHCFLKIRGELNTGLLDTKKILKVIDFFSKNKVFLVAFTGGDPILHPDLFSILNYTYKKNMLPLLGTSGTRITETVAKKIYLSGVSCVQLSLEGTNVQLNKNSRTLEGFNDIVRSIKILKKYPKIKINLAFCLYKENYHNLKNMLLFAMNNKISNVKIQIYRNYINTFDGYTELNLSE